MRRAEQVFGNPSSLHSFGQAARALVDRARERIAAAIGAGFREVVFTGSATEANNLALRGMVKAYQRKSALRNQHQSASNISVNQHPIISANQRPRLIISAIEHESVLETARDLERSGEAELVVIPVNRRGIVDVKALAAALDERTVLVSVMQVNNETGVIEPIQEIASVINDFRKSHVQRAKGKGQRARRGEQRAGHSLFALSHLPLLHSDAAQAFAYLDCNTEKLGVDPVRGCPAGPLRFVEDEARSAATTASGRSASNGVDLMTLSAHKMGGPKGIGALYVRPQIANRKSQRVDDVPLALYSLPLAPLTTGGNHEFGFRAGTENVPLIAGFAEAVTLAVKERTKNIAYAARLKELFLKELKRARVKFMENVPRESASPHILNICFPDLAAEELLVRLDLAGVAVSAGSACTARAVLPSHVLLAMGMPKREVKESIRVSFGVATTAAEVREAARRMGVVLVEMRRRR